MTRFLGYERWEVSIVRNELYRLFERGEYAEICRIFAPDSKGRHLWPVAGAYVFTGQLQRALFVYEDIRLRGSSVSRENKLGVFFFTVIGLIRNSDYKKAFEICQIMQREPLRGPLSHFFVWQAIAFYYYFCCSYPRSHRFLVRSMKAAFESKHAWAGVMALDLSGHVSLQLGRVREGLKYLTEAEEKARESLNLSFADSIRNSFLQNVCAFGLAEDPILELSRAIKEAKSLFYRNELLLELARQWILRGSPKNAKRILEGALDDVYAKGGRRQVATLNLRFAYLLYLEGRFKESIDLIGVALRSTIPKVDLVLISKLKGLKVRALRQLKLRDFAERESSQVAELDRKTGAFLNRRIRGRHEAHSLKFPKGEDALGDLIDRAAAKDRSVLQLLIQKKYFGLLSLFLEASDVTPVISFELIPRSVVICFQNEVHFETRKVGNILKKIALAITAVPRTKQELVDGVWGYSYESQRHDTLVYAAMSNLRSVLGPFEKWLEASEGGYFLQMRLHAFEDETESPPSIVAKLDRVDEERVALFTSSGLSFRQIQILSQWKQGEALTVQTLSQWADISMSSALRDLQLLTQEGYFKKVGRARATHYLRLP